MTFEEITKALRGGKSDLQTAGCFNKYRGGDSDRKEVEKNISQAISHINSAKKLISHAVNINKAGY